MWRVIVIGTVIWFFSSPMAYAQQGSWTGNINAFLGAKALDETDWEPVDEHGEIGFKVDFKQRSWPVSIAIDFLFSSGDDTLLGVDFEGETSELNLGVRKIWDQFPHVRPFIGGGISFISAEFKGTVLGVPVSDDDAGTGIWFGGGVYWTLAEHFNIGLELGVSTANVTLFGVEASAGGGHSGVLAGYHW